MNGVCFGHLPSRQGPAKATSTRVVTTSDDTLVITAVPGCHLLVVVVVVVQVLVVVIFPRMLVTSSGVGRLRRKFSPAPLLALHAKTHFCLDKERCVCRIQKGYCEFDFHSIQCVSPVLATILGK